MLMPSPRKYVEVGGKTAIPQDLSIPPPIQFRQVLNVFPGKFFWTHRNVQIELTEIGLMATSDEVSQKELAAGAGAIPRNR